MAYGVAPTLQPWTDEWGMPAGAPVPQAVPPVSLGDYATLPTAPMSQPTLAPRQGSPWADVALLAGKAIMAGIPGAQGSLAAVQGFEQQQMLRRKQDQEAAKGFLSLHAQLAKMPPGPEKAFLIDQLGQYGERVLGQPIDKNYLAMLKKQTQEQQEAWTQFLTSIQQRGDLPLTQGLLPLVQGNPQLLLQAIASDREQKKQEDITRHYQDELKLQREIMGFVGIPTLGGGASASVPPAPQSSADIAGASSAPAPGVVAQSPARPPVVTNVSPTELQGMGLVPGPPPALEARPQRPLTQPTVTPVPQVPAPPVGAPGTDAYLASIDKKIDDFTVALAAASRMTSKGAASTQAFLKGEIDRLRDERNRIERGAERAQTQAQRQQEQEYKQTWDNIQPAVAQRLKEKDITKPTGTDIAQASEEVARREAERKLELEREMQPLRERLEIVKSNAQPLPPETQRKLTGLAQTGSIAQALRTEFTPEERAKFVGRLGFNRTAQQVRAAIEDFSRKAPSDEARKFARFASLVALQATEVFTTVGQSMTNNERDIGFGYLLSGKEFSTAEFEEKLRLATQRIPAMIDSTLTLAKTPRGDVTPESLQRPLPAPADVPASATPLPTAQKPDLKTMTPAAIRQLSDEALNALTREDIKGLSRDRLDALEGRMRQQRR